MARPSSKYPFQSLLGKAQGDLLSDDSMKKIGELLRMAAGLGLLLIVLPILRFLPLPWPARILLILAVAIVGLLPVLRRKKHKRKIVEISKRSSALLK